MSIFPAVSPGCIAWISQLDLPINSTVEVVRGWNDYILIRCGKHSRVLDEIEIHNLYYQDGTGMDLMSKLTALVEDLKYSIALYEF